MEDNRMPKSVSIRIPHDLGKNEARRRIEEGFGRLRQQLGGGLLGMVKFDERWVGDQLQFSGGTLGQVVTGRVDVLADVVQIELDLPELLAAIANRIAGRMQQEGRLLLAKK
jgi:hypothetical protein